MTREQLIASYIEEVHKSANRIIALKKIARKTLSLTYGNGNAVSNKEKIAIFSAVLEQFSNVPPTLVSFSKRASKAQRLDEHQQRQGSVRMAFENKSILELIDDLDSFANEG